jgi:ankyrin repeat protein
MSVDIVKQRYEIYDKVIDIAKQFRELNKLIEKRPITWKDRYKLNCLKRKIAGSYKPIIENQIDKLENELFDNSNLEVLNKIKTLENEFQKFIDSTHRTGLKRIIHSFDYDDDDDYGNDYGDIEFKPKFFKAVMSGNYDLCEALLNEGYNPNMEQQHVNGNDSHYSAPTPIYDAIEFGHINICELLLDHGAEFYLCDFKGRTPLQFACVKGQVEVCEFFKYYTRNQKLKTYRRRQHLIAALES